MMALVLYGLPFAIASRLRTNMAKKHSADRFSSVLCFFFFSLLYFYLTLLFHLRSADILHLALTTFYFRTDRIPHLCSDRSTPHTNPAAEGSDCLRQ